MTLSRTLRLGVLLAWTASTGCMTLREIPRQEYGAVQERKNVRVVTQEGLLYEFDWADVVGDTLVGYRNRLEVEGPVDQLAQVRLPVDDVRSLSARGIDWRRTAIVGGGVVAGALAVSLSQSLRHADTSSGSSGGHKPPPTVGAIPAGR